MIHLTDSDLRDLPSFMLEGAFAGMAGALLADRPFAAPATTSRHVCPILMAWDPDLRPDASLRAGFVLPAAWTDALDRDDVRLPGALLELAARVREEVAAALGADLSQWKLAWAIADPPSFEQLSVSVDSAWAILAISLRLAHEDARHAGDLYASMACDATRGAYVVDRLTEKIAALARAHTTDRPARLFVHEDQELPAEVPPQVTIAHLRSSTTALLDVIAPALALADARPGPSAPFDEQCAWANRPWRDDGQRDRWYLDYFAAEQGKRLRARYAAELGATEPSRVCLITTPSQRSLYALLEETIRPDLAMLFWHQTRLEVDEASTRAVTREQIEMPADFLGDLRALIPEWRARIPADAWVVVDLTGGLKTMSLALLELGRSLDQPTRILYVNTERDARRQTLYGTETFTFFEDPSGS